MTDLPVYIDDRQGSKELVKYPPLDETGELCRLDFGDAWIMGNGPDSELASIGVEVKSVHDLVSSINTGRLQAHQVPGMLESYDQCWLLYYGDHRPAPRDGRLQVRTGKQWKALKLGKRFVPYGYIESLLFDLAALGFRVRNVKDPREAAYWIGCLHRWWSKPWDKHKGMKTFDKSRELTLMPGVDSNLELRARVAAQLPGIGYTRAMAAARYFGSIRRLIMGHRSDWARIEGIGPVLADAVITALKQEDEEKREA